MVESEYDAATDTLVCVVRTHVNPDRMEQIEDFTFHVSEDGEVVAFEVEQASNYFDMEMLWSV